ncbi:homeobox-leucine zipper protein HOX11-like [Magnolia sinica]|uniref:homeobox-leucine zipper protein HOX11-like n=1 Tax=Magnolia sinica TaxID=86752 RepID=UPI002657C87C|nr:homeobox-leucine zipper protein HOX11-like [Magnolia sinica]
MELALSVGGNSDGGEPSRKRRICGLFGDRVRQGFIVNGLDDIERSRRRNCAPVQLDLKLSWSTDTGNNYEAGRSSDQTAPTHGHLDVNQIPIDDDPDNEMGPSSSDSRPTVAGKRDCEAEMERASSRCSDEEEGGSTRKKLRLSKEQSCYLEESFKEHPTLNPKQKLALAKQLNLRPRQVEVWFQNRRARTKLKQTEVDCEYLKRCCESLTEENRRLHKELQDLKALKSSHSPFQMHVPATTLTMCPSCERVTTPNTDNSSKTGDFGGPKSRFGLFSQRTSATS